MVTKTNRTNIGETILRKFVPIGLILEQSAAGGSLGPAKLKRDPLNSNRQTREPQLRSPSLFFGLAKLNESELQS